MAKNALGTKTYKTFNDKELQEQLEVVADILEDIDAKGKNKTAITQLCRLLRSGNLQDSKQGGSTVNPGLHFSSAEAREISGLLTIGSGSTAKVLIAPADVNDVNKFLNALREYVNATRKSINALNSVIDLRDDKIEELNQVIEQITRERDSAIRERDELRDRWVNANLGGSRLKKVASKTVQIAAAVALSAGLVFFATQTYLLNKDLNVANDATISAQAERDQAQAERDKVQGELEEVKGALGENLEEGADVSDTVGSVVGNLANAESERDKAQGELEEVKGALGGNLEEGADVSDAVGSVVGSLENAEKELEEITTVLTENNQEVTEGDVSQAVADLVNGIKEGTIIEDGINQTHVDAVFTQIVSALSDLGITEDLLKDDDGNFSTEKLSEALADIVEKAIADQATIKSISDRINMVLSTIEKEEGVYSIEDFKGEDGVVDLNAAFNFIDEHIAKLLDSVLSVIDKGEEGKYSIDDFKIEIQDGLYTTIDYEAAFECVKGYNAELASQIEKLYDDLGAMSDQYDEAQESLEQAQTEIDRLKKENAVLEDLVRDENNLDQEGTGGEKEEGSSDPVGDKEVDENTGVSRDEHPNSKDPSSEEYNPGC